MTDLELAHARVRELERGALRVAERLNALLPTIRAAFRSSAIFDHTHAIVMLGQLTAAVEMIAPTPRPRAAVPPRLVVVMDDNFNESKG